ncbi:MAG: NAD-binding protein [Candidatus Nanoarchaeia archaeon]|jgi:voltage-gated potassium channel|nr:NAD-binding protein [Candidatus Nanoarchaeia archaeon]
MGKIEVPLDKLASRLGMGILALIILIAGGGLIIALDQGVGAQEGMLLSLSFATHIEAGTLSNAEIWTKAVFVTLAFAGEVLAFYVFYVMIEFLLSGEFNKKLGGVKDRSMVRNLKNHIIVCGGGRVGRNVCMKLKDSKQGIVVIDKDDLSVEKLKRAGFHAILGDANDESVLREAGVEHAHSLAAVIGDDGDNLLTILTAKELNPELSVAARANDENIVSKLKHAGAEVVILPEVVGGLKLADALLGDIDHSHVIHHPENRKKNTHAKHTGAHKGHHVIR